MKLKTNELTGAALDWAVAKCEGYTDYCGATDKMLSPRKEQGWVPLYDLNHSIDWAQGGPIIERESIGFTQGNEVCDDWVASYSWIKPRIGIDDSVEGIGPTPLIAAMRCYVASKLGDEVDVPEGLA
jgi:hypothetical protein